LPKTKWKGELRGSREKRTGGGKKKDSVWRSRKGKNSKKNVKKRTINKKDRGLKKNRIKKMELILRFWMEGKEGSGNLIKKGSEKKIRRRFAETWGS